MGSTARSRPCNRFMPRAKGARGKVHGALPRTPARGDTPLRPPARFPFRPRFQNGPRPPGCAPENLFKTGKDFPPPRINRAPWTAAGRSEDLAMTRESGQMQSQNHPRCAPLCSSRWSVPHHSYLFKFNYRKEAWHRSLRSRLQAHSSMRKC